MVSHTSLLVSALEEETAVVFPDGTNSVFIGHSFFIPFAREFNKFAKSKNDYSYKEYPYHYLETFHDNGSHGSPHELWNHHKEDIKELLNGRDVQLFATHIGYIYDTKRDQWHAPVENIIHSYKRWINLALSYNSTASIYIALPWVNRPDNYDSTSFMAKIQETADVAYNDIIVKLRKKYPSTNIYFFNYGSIAVAAMKLFEEGKLTDIDYLILDESIGTSTKANSLFSDESGHAADLLRQLTGLSWLNWLYEGKDFKTFAKTVKEEYDMLLDWDQQNIEEIYEVVELMNKKYRL